MSDGWAGPDAGCHLSSRGVCGGVVAVVLVPMLVLLVPCLLALLERRVVVDPVIPRSPVARRDVDAEQAAPVAPVIALRPGVASDGDTLPLRRAS